jgi:phosphopantetheine adenylyltransferase
LKADIAVKEGHYIMIKRSIQQEDRTIINIYSPNAGVSCFAKQTQLDLTGKIRSNTRTVRDFSTPLS